MQKVTQEQMDTIVSILDKPIEEQKTVFDDLNLSPYENYANNAGDIGGILIISEGDINDRLESAQKSPSDYTGFTEKRIIEIEAGSLLTEDEIEIIKAQYIQECIEDDGSEFLVSTEISDEKRSIFVLYAEQMQGQGGLNIINFFGFFETDEELEKAMQSFEDVILYDMFA